MLAGVPAATFAIDEAGATDVALFAVALLATTDPTLRYALVLDRQRRHDEAASSTLPPA